MYENARKKCEFLNHTCKTGFTLRGVHLKIAVLSRVIKKHQNNYLGIYLDPHPVSLVTHGSHGTVPLIHHLATVGRNISIAVHFVEHKKSFAACAKGHFLSLWI